MVLSPMYPKQLFFLLLICYNWLGPTLYELPSTTKQIQNHFGYYTVFSESRWPTQKEECILCNKNALSSHFSPGHKKQINKTLGRIL